MRLCGVCSAVLLILAATVFSLSASDKLRHRILKRSPLVLKNLYADLVARQLGIPNPVDHYRKLYAKTMPGVNMEGMAVEKGYKALKDQIRGINRQSGLLTVLRANARDD